MLKPQLVEILQCVQCRGPLDYQPDSHDTTRGKLICHNCRIAFRVENDIPILLLDEAISLNGNEETESAPSGEN